MILCAFSVNLCVTKKTDTELNGGDTDIEKNEIEPGIIINFERNYDKMENYICENVFVPLRSGPSHKSEMLSQVLFGEKYTVMEKSGSWMKIETLFDKYAGWIDMDHLQHSPAEGSSYGHVLNMSLLCYKADKTKLVLEAGCEIFNPDFEDKTFEAGKNIYSTVPEFSNNHIVYHYLDSMSFYETSLSCSGGAPNLLRSSSVWIFFLRYLRIFL